MAILINQKQIKNNKKKKKRKSKHTTAALVFNVNDGPFFSPIDGIRQTLAVLNDIPVTRLRRRQPPSRPGLGSQVLGPVLLVGQVSEPVQTQLVRPVLRVVLVDEPQVVLKYLEPSLLLSQGVVVLAVADQPRLEHGRDLVVGSPVGFAGADDRHVQRR